MNWFSNSLHGCNLNEFTPQDTFLKDVVHPKKRLSFDLTKDHLVIWINDKYNRYAWVAVAQQHAFEMYDKLDKGSPFGYTCSISKADSLYFEPGDTGFIDSGLVNVPYVKHNVVSINIKEQTMLRNGQHGGTRRRRPGGQILLSDEDVKRMSIVLLKFSNAKNG